MLVINRVALSSLKFYFKKLWNNISRIINFKTLKVVIKMLQAAFHLGRGEDKGLGDFLKTYFKHIIFPILYFIIKF